MRDIDAIASRVAELLGRSYPNSRPGESLRSGASPLSTRGTRKQGKTWGVDVRIDGHRITKGGFSSQARAAEWLYRARTDRAVLEDYLRSRLDRKQVTVAACVECYMDGRGAHCASAERHLEYAAHLLPVVGDLIAEGVGQSDVDHYLQKRIAEGASEKTAHNEACFLRTALRYARRSRLLRDYPCFQLHTPKCARKRVLREVEAARLLAAAPVELRRVMVAAITCGLRRGEIINAEWSWLRGNELVLPAASTKTKTGRTVPLGPVLLALLQQEPRHPRWLFARWRAGRNGKRQPVPEQWEKTALKAARLALCARCGVTDLRLHDLRRSMSTLGQERGHAAMIVQALGGWEDPGVMAQHYSHAGPDAMRAVVEDLEKMLVGSPSAPAEPSGKTDDARVWN